jgi:hypothetical protein
METKILRLTVAMEGIGYHIDGSNGRQVPNAQILGFLTACKEYG